MTTGYEIITDDDEWWVIGVWTQGIFVTKLLEKSEYNFNDVLTWIEKNEKG